MSDPTLPRRAVACPGWRWLAGMRVWRLSQSSGQIHYNRLTEAWPEPDDSGWLPDLADPCTLGGLEALVRERWGDGAHASPDRGRNPNPDWWVWRKIIDGWTVVARGPTRAAALVAALEAP